MEGLNLREDWRQNHMEKVRGARKREKERLIMQKWETKGEWRKREANSHESEGGQQPCNTGAVALENWTGQSLRARYVSSPNLFLIGKTVGTRGGERPWCNTLWSSSISWFQITWARVLVPCLAHRWPYHLNWITSESERRCCYILCHYTMTAGQVGTLQGRLLCMFPTHSNFSNKQWFPLGSINGKHIVRKGTHLILFLFWVKAGLEETKTDTCKQNAPMD